MPHSRSSSIHQTVKTPETVVFGPGSRKELGGRCAALGHKALVVTGVSSLASSGALDEMLASLSEHRIRFETFRGVRGEPTVETIEDIRRFLKETRCDFVVAAGGGSVIDAAKAAAALVEEDHPVSDYLQGRGIKARILPLAAVPTTAGTGSEATPNAVVTDPSRPVKRSIRHPLMMPRLAIVDPELSYPCPRQVAAAAALDAFVQAVEAHTSRHAGALTRAFSAQAIRLIGPHLYAVCSGTASTKAKDALSAGALLAGMAMANARAGAVHGLAHPLGARFGVPHGLACGLLFPHIVELNRPAVDPLYRNDVLPFLEAPGAGPDDTLAERFRRILEHADLPLSVASAEVPSSEEEWTGLASECMDSGSFRANARDLRTEEVVSVLRKVLVHPNP